MTDDRESMRTQAARLGFDVPDEVLDQCLATADQLAEAAGTLTAEELHQDDSDTPTVGSEVTVEATGDHNELLATYAEPRHSTNEGPLAGLDVAVKDNLLVQELPVTCGAEVMTAVPSQDAAVVERMLDAGARVVGKANMDAFAFGPSGEFSDYGPVTNPHAADRVPGGSSSGSGAAVAAGTVDVALGSDTGGSVRIPAACCGVVGAKPTHGVVPRHGFIGFAPSLDTIGPLAQRVEDAARTLHVLAGPDRRDPTVSQRGLPDFSDGFTIPESVTVGLPTSLFERATDTVSTAVRTAVAETTGVEGVEVALPLGAIEQAYFLIGAAEFVWYLDQTGVVRGQGSDYTEVIRQALAQVKDRDLGAHIAQRLLPAAYLDTQTDGQAYAAARQEALRFVEQVKSAFAEVDVLVSPTLRTLPPTREQMETTEDMLTLLGNTAPFNLAGTPAVAVPVTERDGLPVSAQVVAPQFADLSALAVAERLAGTV